MRVLDKPAPGARADRRKAESRQRLLEAARRLFIGRGYHETRPQDITRAADLGHSRRSEKKYRTQRPSASG